MAQITAKQAAEALFAAIQANDQAQIEQIVEVIKDPQNKLVMEEVQAELKKLQDGSTPKQAQPQPQQKPQQTAKVSNPMKSANPVSAELPDLFNAKGLTGAFRWAFIILLIGVCLINSQPYLEFFRAMFLERMPNTIVSYLFIEAHGVSILGTILGFALFVVIQIVELRKCYSQMDYYIKNLTYALDLAIGIFVYPPFTNFNFNTLGYSIMNDIAWEQIFLIFVQLAAVEMMAVMYCHFAKHPSEIVGSQR